MGSTVNIYYGADGVKYLTARLNTTGGTRIAKCMINYKRPSQFVQPAYSWHLEVDPVYTSDDQYLGNLRVNDVIPCSGGSFIDQLLCSMKPNANVQVINGCDGVFDKPIIVVEGFDPVGDLTITEMVRRFSKMDFMTIMQAYGYDFVFVDFTKNTTYIENNAKVLEAVINLVNQTKVGSFNSTVIGFSMGGLIARWCLKDMEDRGLQHHVANFFSYDAPQQGANIPLGMQYIFKEMVRDMPYLKWNKDLRKLDDAYKDAGARQMLVTYASYNNGPFDWFPNLYTLDPLRSAFAQRLQAKGYPQQARNFGIAFGRGDNILNTKSSGNGNQFTQANPFGPQTQIFHGALAFLLVNAEALANAVPENNTKATIAYYSFFGLTFRKIFGFPLGPTPVLRVRRFDYTGQYPYDDAIGSFEQTQTDFVRSWVGGASGPATTNGHDGHNFVATASALDLQNQGYSSNNSWQSNNMFFNIDNQIQNPGQLNGNTLAPGTSPFSAVMTGTSDCTPIGGCTSEPYLDANNNFIYPSNSNAWNHFHNADMTYQSALFIERNILNAYPSFNCQTQSFCNFSPSISGPDVVCTTAQYQLNNLPNGVNIVWESVNGYFAITNGQGTAQIEVSLLTVGSDYVRVTLTNSCGNTRVIQIPVTVTMAPSSNTLVPSYSTQGYSNWLQDNNCLKTYTFPGFYSGNISLSDPVATSFAWTYVSKYPSTAIVNISYSDPRYATVTVKPSGARVTYRLTVSNSCGSYSHDYTFVANGACGIEGPQIINTTSDFSIVPNPARDYATISMNSNTIDEKNNSSNLIYGIKITDATGVLRRSFEYKSGVNPIIISLSGLTSGLYFVSVFNGQNWISKQLLIEK